MSESGATAEERAISTARGELVVAVVGMLLGAALVLFAASRGWATLHVDRDRPLAALRRTVKGSTAQPLLTAMGIVGLAGVVALLATRRVGRSLVGLVVALAGVVVLLRALGDVHGISAGRAQSLLTGSGPVVGVRAGARVTVDLHAGSVVLAVVGGALLLLVGGLAAVRGHRWPAMGSRYERPESSEQAATSGDRRLWEALDRGEDPTAR